MDSATYKIGVAHYKGHSDVISTFNWAIVVRKAHRQVICYQLQGSQYNFSLAPTNQVELLARSLTFRGAFEIGEFEASKLTQLETIITQVPIHNDIPGWDSQHWVVSALERIRSAGIVSSARRFTREFILEGLEEVTEEWEAAESTFCDSD